MNNINENLERVILAFDSFESSLRKSNIVEVDAINRLRQISEGLKHLVS